MLNCFLYEESRPLKTMKSLQRQRTKDRMHMWMLIIEEFILALLFGKQRVLSLWMCMGIEETFLVWLLVSQKSYVCITVGHRRATNIVPVVYMAVE